MRAIRTGRLLVLIGVALVAIGFGGAASASETSDCNEGRAFCITVIDQDDVSHSTTGINRYTEYRVGVRNDGGSTLTNGYVDVVLKDVVRTTVNAGTPDEMTTEQEVAPTGQFVAAPAAGCTPSGPSTSFRCTLANLAGMQPAPELRFFARTSTNTSAAAMRLIVTAGFKEKGRDSEGPASQSDTLEVKETTELEPQPEFSASVYFGGAENVVLSTTPGAGGQSSIFRLPKVDGFPGFELATLEELDSGDPGYCPSAGSVSCFGQTVAVFAPSVFSGDNPANLRSTIDLSLVTRGVTEKSLVVHHDGVPILDACTGEIGQKPDQSELPCRRVKFDRRAGIATVDAWDFDQGNWGFS